MLRAAVIGAGNIGRIHAGVYRDDKLARLAAVCDIVRDKADAFAAEFGARAYASVDELLRDEEIDLVSVTTAGPENGGHHYEPVMQCLAAGKAVLCEKPIDLDLAKVDASWARIEERKPVIMVGFNRRFDASFKALRDRIHAGEIGKPEQVVITSRDPGPPPLAYIEVSGGLFRDMTIHDFDMARYLMGDIQAVHATGVNVVDPAIKEAGDIDAAMITLVGRSGALCQISNSRRCAYGYDQRIEAFGQKGMLQAGNQRPTTVSFWGAAATEARDPVLNFFIERYTPAYHAEIDHFVDCVE